MERSSVRLPRLAGQPGQGGLVQQGIWMEAVRLLEGERGLMMDWREAVVRVVRRAVVVRRVGVRSFIFFGWWCGVVFKEEGCACCAV